MKFTISSLMILCMSLSWFQSDKPINQSEDSKSITTEIIAKQEKAIVTDDYIKEWKVIDSLINKRLPKSALEKVEILYEKVGTTDNDGQIIKCVIYRNRLLIELEDKNPSVAIIRLEEHIKSEENLIAKSVMTSMAAELYFLYAQRNQYKIQQRTFTVEEPSDIATWSLKSLINKSNQLYLESVNQQHDNSEVLDEYKAILIPAANELEFASDINSFLLHRVVRHFSNSRSLVTEPVYAFVMDDEAFLSDTDSFINLDLNSKDSTSFKLQALKSYQTLLIYLKEKGRQDELVYADLFRLGFVHSHLVHDKKGDLYFEQLNALREKYKSSPVSTQIAFNSARYLQALGGKYRNKFEKKYKGKMKEALLLAEAAAIQFPNSSGAKNCRSVVNEIKRKEIRLQVEEVVGANSPYLVRSAFRNIDSVVFHTYPITNSQLNDFNRFSRKEKIEHLLKLNSVKTVVKILPEIDYNHHATEHMLDGLGFGQYLIVATDQLNIRSAEMISYGNFRVSNLAYSTQMKNGNLEVLVFHRISGKPMPSVEVRPIDSKYGRIVSSPKKYDAKYTNADGRVDFSGTDKSIRLLVKDGEDVLDLTQDYYLYDNRDSESYSNCHLFTDRRIYRPGQKVFFKGLFLEYDKNRMPELMTGNNVKVTLKNANYQDVTSSSFETNDYGTFHGNFELPSGGLNGSFILEVNNGNRHVGSVSIRVEDYKRPKFEVTIDTIDVNYQLGDTVALTGQAKTFAGTPVDEVKVKYRITRSRRFAYRYWWRPYSTKPDQEIANGETTTRQDGSFEIEVPLTAPSDVNKSAIYNYKVTVDVVDISGETQSVTSSIQSSNTSVFASLDLEKEVDLGDLKEVKIKTNNINGKHVDANGIIEIDKLVTDDFIYAKRYWQKTDTTLVNEEEWKKQVPQYKYDIKDELDQLAIEKRVLKEGFNTGLSKTINLASGLEVGVYKITCSVGDDSNTQYLFVNDFAQSEFGGGELFYYKGLETSYQPGDQVALQLGSVDKDLYVYAEVVSNGDLKSTKWFKLNSTQSIKFKIEEGDRGGVYIKLHCASNNRIFNKLIKVNVPWTNKELKIEYTSIRNKIAPGSEEQWQIKISGDKKEKLSAELLATMYDASLDQLAGKHTWNLKLYPDNYLRSSWSAFGYGARYLNQIKQARLPYTGFSNPTYPSLNWFGLKSMLGMYERTYHRSSVVSMSDQQVDVVMEESGLLLDEVVVTGNAKSRRKEMASAAPSVAGLDGAVAGVEAADVANAPPAKVQVANPDENLNSVSPRTNLNETVFFFPDMQTDEEGNIMINFTMNEALTKWTFMTLAHTTDLEYGFAEQDITTFKNLMVFPNPPRFIRQGDLLKFTAKVQNMTEETLSADTRIELIDAVTEKSLIDDFNIATSQSQVAIAPQSSELLSWDLSVPANFTGLVRYRVLASDGTYSDGEESYLPALTNRMMVTETMPMNVKGNQTKTFTFDSFISKSKSSTLTHENFAVEYTSNPAWYAIQAMPYLMEYPHECTEQLLNRYFANALSSHVANATPKIKQVFEAWKTIDKEALLSNLSKNQELKSVLLEETPWVMHAKSEEAQKQNLGLLFDLNRMSFEQEIVLNKLVQRQSSNGGFSWFPNGRESRYITQYVAEGLGHLNKLNVTKQSNKSNQIIRRAIPYLDKEVEAYFKKLMDSLGDAEDVMDHRHISSLDIHYLYARSFHNRAVPANSLAAYEFFMSQAEKYWTEFSLYEQAMIALVMHRSKKEVVATDILKSIKERSILHDELGRYWKLSRGYNWYQHPIETQALMIELFSEMGETQDIIDELRVWLLKNKQTNSWKTTKATAAAIYALMINKDESTNSWLDNNEQVQMTYGKSEVAVDFDKAQAGTLYTKKTFDKSEINTNLSTITVSNPNDVISWGSAYWQYFEDLDKITTFEDTPLQLKKQLFIESINDEGAQLTAVSATNPIKQGDKIKVRIELRVDRRMEFVHMKDMRASGFEPISVLSRHKYQDGLSYYESTRDVATDFFFSRLPKGTYVFEYELRATHKGTFSNGITTIQSMYATEFTSHSEGVEVIID